MGYYRPQPGDHDYGINCPHKWEPTRRGEIRGAKPGSVLICRKCGDTKPSDAQYEVQVKGSE